MTTSGFGSGTGFFAIVEQGSSNEREDVGIFSFVPTVQLQEFMESQFISINQIRGVCVEKLILGVDWKLLPKGESVLPSLSVVLLPESVMKGNFRPEGL